MIAQRTLHISLIVESVPTTSKKCMKKVRYAGGFCFAGRTCRP